MISEIEGEFRATREKVLKARSAIRHEISLIRNEIKQFKEKWSEHERPNEEWSD